MIVLASLVSRMLCFPPSWKLLPVVEIFSNQANIYTVVDEGDDGARCVGEGHQEFLGSKFKTRGFLFGERYEMQLILLVNLNRAPTRNRCGV